MWSPQTAEDEEEFWAEVNRQESVNIDRKQKREMEAQEMVLGSDTDSPRPAVSGRRFRNNAIEVAIQKVLGGERCGKGSSSV